MDADKHLSGRDRSADGAAASITSVRLLEMIMAPQVVAAWIAAAAAIGAAAVNIYFTLFNERRRRDAEMMITALGYFEGKSQRRSVGIAALEVLRSRSKAWNEYRETVRQLFYRQLLYLFSHGVNRWETHEVANMEQMAVWLLDGKTLPAIDEHMRNRIHLAVKRYETDWANLRAEERKEYDTNSVGKMLERVRTLMGDADYTKAGP